MKQLEPQQPLQLQQPPEQHLLLQLGEMKQKHVSAEGPTWRQSEERRYTCGGRVGKSGNTVFCRSFEDTSGTTYVMIRDLSLEIKFDSTIYSLILR